MLKIEVKNEVVNERNGTTNGRQWQIREQDAWWYQDNEPFPVKIRVNLDRDQSPYKAGFYELLPASFYVGKYGQLVLGRIQLKAVNARAAA